MSDQNLSLYAASYADADAADADWEVLQDLRDLGEVKLPGAILAEREADGTIKVHEHGRTATKAGAAIGAAAGVVVGLFAPPLLLSGVVGLALGAGIGDLVKRHEQKEIGVDLEEYLPPDSSAIVVLVDDAYLDRVDHALTKAGKKINKAVDKGDYDKLVKALESGADMVDDAIDS